jgi:membrane-associated phospholipid phosphatase
MKNALRISLALGGGALSALAWYLMRWDHLLLSWFYIRPVSLVDVVRPLDYFGSWMVLIPLAGLSLAVFWRPGWVWLALRPMAALAASEAIAEGLKIYLHRTRPASIAMTSDFWGQSFPSEHAFSGFAVWFSVGQVLGELWPEGRAFTLTMAALIGLLTGWSQVFLGVNWTTDVIAGWGFALLLIAAIPGPFPPQAGRVKKKK